MLTNADITIYNHIYDKATRLDEWRRTVIHGVHFYVDNKVSVGDSGLNSADVYKIRIPEDAECDSQYAPEDEYASADMYPAGRGLCRDRQMRSGNREAG